MPKPKRSASAQSQRQSRQKAQKSRALHHPTTPNALIRAKRDDDDDDDDDDEEDDDDYDPSKKPDVPEEDSEVSDDETQPDYSAINTDISQVRTRGQKYKETSEYQKSQRHAKGLLEDTSRMDIDAIFQQLKAQTPQKTDEWEQMVRSDEPAKEAGKTGETPSSSGANANSSTAEDEKVRIFTTYTFAGKLVRESKVVDANSAEAKAYLNSTNGLTTQEDTSGPRKSYVTVVRAVCGTDEQKELRIKLKRPSLIDKFLMGDKKNKLTTLEKSRLDWASFVDKKKLKDDLAIHNKGGYLEKQDFLGRMEAKRDTQYQQAKELERQRQWQQQQQQQSQRS
ncbi:hypothetical protein JCM33374_g2428 [Metschnikowia sp. JCM 33374]|nr:hypothetical protein JCM33374_g2428 [Metschnikowia sp. JCM 33374]